MNITNVLQDDLCDKLRFDHRQITNLGIGKEGNKRKSIMKKIYIED